LTDQPPPHFLSVLVVTLLLVIGALSGAIPRPLFAAHVVSAIVIAVIPRYFELRYAFFVPLNSLLLLTSFGSRLPRSVRLSGQWHSRCAAAMFFGAFGHPRFPSISGRRNALLQKRPAHSGDRRLARLTLRP
jgi:hypothetical protein